MPLRNTPREEEMGAWSWWYGGSQPVPDGTKVEYITETGYRSTNLAENLWWAHDNDGGNIVEYRVHYYAPPSTSKPYEYETTDFGDVLTGGSSDYYKVDITSPTRYREPYTAECNDIIEALQMNFAEGNVFKAVWRHAANRLGKGKPGNTLLYDAEKIEFFGKRLVAMAMDL